ncbi:MAG: histidine kinase [Acidobacteria bacterium]|nr:MAG: histidine kinase [Acidobacteriota bacterium]
MKKSPVAPISTVKDLCRVCYTCVRDCPAKAIRITGGQALIIHERCITCGHCVEVCRQKAKKPLNLVNRVIKLLKGPDPCAAIIAPSFPAEFQDQPYKETVGQIRSLGFDKVCEVAAGADLVAQAHKELLKEDKNYIATSCPAVVSFVKKYHPGLVEKLAPIASPMVVTARLLKEMYGKNLKIVFMGPCIAKKSESYWPETENVIDAAITFVELRELLGHYPDRVSQAEPSMFDAPYPGKGVLFPIGGGMLQTAGIQEDLLSKDVLATSGKANFVQAIHEFDEGSLDVKLLEVLCCDGCIMGPGMSSKGSLFGRRGVLRSYAVERLNEEEGREQTLPKVQLGITFNPDDRRLPLPSKREIDKVLEHMGKTRPEDELDCGACGYVTCREHAVAILKGLAETEMCLPFTIDRLKSSLDDLNVSHHELEEAQQALLNAEKLASMGQLSAGIAHEINNPLGVILLYGKLVLDEMDPESENREDLEMIIEQAERCKTIVSGLLNFARKNKVSHQLVNICDLIDNCSRAFQIPDHIQLVIQHELKDPMVEVDPDQMVQVLTNLVKNSKEAIGESGTICIRTTEHDTKFHIEVQDNGSGIPENVIKKIFEPLFTTKKIGKGTGLGLAVIYGIIKMHKGQITVTSNDDPEQGPTGTTFRVVLPRRNSNSVLKGHNGLLTGREVV